MTPELRGLVRGERLLRDLEALAAFGALPAGGISRTAFSPAFKEAADWLIARMQDAGLDTRIDAAGNIIGRLGPKHGPAVVCGSHIDTVPGGGPLDGALGVLAGLECARVFSDAGLCRTRAFEVIAFSDEEGAYVSLLGSRAMMGDIDPASLTSDEGTALANVMARAGLDISQIARAARPPSEIAAYLELHIEQGPVLETAGLSVGIVDAIVGMDLVQYRVQGEARHAGSTPMALRRDAGRGACLAVSRAYEDLDASTLRDTGRMTFGAMTFHPGASNVVPASAVVTSEVRAGSSEDLVQLRDLVDRAFERTAADSGLSVRKENSQIDDPAPLAPTLIETIRRAARKAGLPTLQMPSGACHDAQILARKVPAGMIFVSSRGGISHHPDEFSDPAAILAGTELLLCALGDILASGASAS